MKRKFILLSCLLTTLPATSFSWNAMGHMLVAQIAYEHLTPTTKKQVDQLASIVGESYPKVNNFVAGAPWADDIKGDGVTEYNTWHYINIGFSNDGTHVPAPPKPNVLTGLQETIHVIKNPNAQPEEKAAALLMATHLVGDLHQPMHAATQFSKSQPQGDAGGNGFTLKGSYKNLHSLWDASVGAYGSNPSRPLSSKSQQSIREEAATLMKTYIPADDERFDLLTPEEWVEESYEVALDYAYNGIRKDTYPSDAYKEQGAIVASDQITIAGYRLAYLLNSLFDAESTKN